MFAVSHQNLIYGPRAQLLGSYPFSQLSKESSFSSAIAWAEILI